MGARPEGLEHLEDWERLLALLADHGKTEASLAFGADEWRAHCAGHEVRWIPLEDEDEEFSASSVEDDIEEIFEVGYRLVGLRDGRLVGLFEPDGQAWASIPGGGWFATSPDGTVHSYAGWLAKQPPEER
jgi:hypothetical protein